MDDESWRSAREPWERVQWARRRTYSTKRAAADALQMNENTYKQYERGPGSSRWANLTYERALEFARKFKVSWVWLLRGEGHPLEQSGDTERDQLLGAFATLTPEQRSILLQLAKNMASSAAPAFQVAEPDTPFVDDAAKAPGRRRGTPEPAKD